MASFDPDAMINRFRLRAEAVKNRGLPPVEGPERARFKEQAQVDFMDYAMIGDATATLDDGILTLTIDLRGNRS
jgi:HSP20 family molecular chaperone IbpA